MKTTLKNSLTVLFLILSVTAANSQNVWQPLSGPSGGPVYSIITGNQSFDFCISPSGIFKTSNNGDSWTQSNPSTINDLYTGAAGINGYIYAATSNYTSFLYRSSDNGNTWEQRLDGGLDFNAMAASPNGTIFAGTFYMFSFHGQFIQDGEIFRSNDNGNSWSSLNFPSLAIQSLKINSNNEIFVGTTDGLFRSANNGASFSVARSGSVGTIFINSLNHIFISTTGSNILRSTDNGSSWVTVSTGPESKMPIAEDGTGNLYTGSMGKLYKSTDNGISWTVFAELLNDSFNEITSIHFKPGNKILVSTSKGVFRSDNNGVSWTEANTGIRDPLVSSISVKTNSIFTASFSSVSRSLNNGETWQVTENGLPNSEARFIEAGSLENVFVYMPPNGLYRSSDNGSSWSSVNSLPTGSTISQMRAKENKLYLALDDGKILRTDNNGINWNDITNNLPDSITISGFNLDHQNSLYASVQRGSFFTPLKGIYKSTDDGASWIEINNEVAPEDLAFNSQGKFFAKYGNSLLRSDNGGINFTQITTLSEYVIDFEVGTSGQIIVSLAEDEIYQIKKSNDDGVAWTDFTGILNNQLVYDLAFDSQSRVLAATQSGVYRTSSPVQITTLTLNTPGSFVLKQNFPNPFNPFTTISYDLKIGDNVSLKVYDALGNEVADLVEERQNAGSYNVLFDASGLSSGIYFYKLKTENFSEVKKMILIK